MNKDRELVYIAIFAAIIAALGIVPGVTLPIAGGVPITAQSLGIMLAGVMLGPMRGALAVLLFLFLVALGLPLLAGGRGGLAVFYSASAGFLVGWPVAAFVAGWIMRATRHLPVFGSALSASLVGGILVLYLIGIPGISLMVDISLPNAALGAIAYLPGDVIKAFIVAAIAQGVARGRPDALLSRA